MFEPTIKYRRVNDPPKDITRSLDNLTIADAKKQEPPVLETTTPKESATKVVAEEKQAQDSPASTKEVIEDTKPAIDDTKNNQPEPELETTTAVSFHNTVKSEPDYTFEEEEDYKIAVDPSDKERIIVTLSTGKQFSADRYCPHAGADLSFHGKVSEHDYPPEIGPILMCPIHYWEFALEKGGKGGGGWATINACPIEVAEKCAASTEKKKLDW